MATFEIGKKYFTTSAPSFVFKFYFTATFNKHIFYCWNPSIIFIWVGGYHTNSQIRKPLICVSLQNGTTGLFYNHIRNNRISPHTTGNNTKVVT